MFFTPLKRSELFKLFTQEEIFENYGVNITDKLFISPLRVDKNPTCKLSWYGDTLVYYDNRPGEFKGDCVSFVARLYNLTKDQSIYRI